MLTKLLKRKEKRLPDILATFNKTVIELENLNNNNVARVSANNDVIKSLTAANQTLEDEAAKARSVKSKISALLT